MTIIIMVSVNTDCFAAQKKVAQGTAEAPLKVTVSTLKELMPYLKQDYVELTMTPGVYRISAADAKAGRYSETAEVVEGLPTHALLYFQGNNSTYDFTDVTVEVESEVVNSYQGRHYGVYEMHVVGSRNVIKNLKLVDVGSIDYAPRYGWVNAVIDGANNRIDGVEINSRGSKPYRYGEVFGKGNKYLIKHQKHSACLVRGNFNHIKDCRIIHRCYGHFLFIQGGRDVLVEGCYIEGEMVSTDIILAEKGSGSAADKIGFKTINGYTLPSGYTLCLGEDGVRSYSNGNTIVDGQRLSKRKTGSVTVRNCTIKHTRAGVGLTLGDGDKVVENCTIIGCQEGMQIASGGKIINCKVDAAFGPALGFAYDRISNVTADITIMPYEGKAYGVNGSKHVAHIQGTGHNITFRKGEGLDPSNDDYYISIGGDRKSIGKLAEDENSLAKGLNFVNETGYKIVLDDNTSNNTIKTNGEVTDEGTNNTITKL